MSWLIVVQKGLKYFVITLLVAILSSLTPDVLRSALGHLPFADVWAMAVVPLLSGLVAAALNAIKHWND